MNSSVTCDSDTSVTSSWRRLIRFSSRSNGPSKLSSRTLNTPAAVASSDTAASSASGAVMIGR